MEETPPNMQTVEEATEWMLAFEEGEVDETRRSAFVAWLRASPAHIDEFMRLSALHQELSLAPHWHEVEQLLEQARTVVPIANIDDDPDVVPAGGEPAGEKPARSVVSRYRMSLAACVAVVVVSLGWFYAALPTVYETARGELHSVVLADGTQIDLNALSAIQVDYSDERRHVALMSGEALFSVLRDDDRPFTVAAGEVTLRVLGTRFNVRRESLDQSRVLLTVLEGRVSVQTAAIAARPKATSGTADGAVPAVGERAMEFVGGEQIVISAGIPVKSAAPNLDSATAWRERRLVFDRTPLNQVIAEFNRHNNRQIILEAPVLSAREITGSFEAGASDALLLLLEQERNVRIDHADEVVTVSLVVPDLPY